MRSLLGAAAIALAMGVLLAPPQVSAATYAVGPGKDYADLGAVQAIVRPGDTVNVDGDRTYPAAVLDVSGTAAQPITYVGVKAQGVRPTISGGTNTLEARASHLVISGFDITGGSSRCFFHHGDDITLRDSAVHGCPDGVMGASTGAGSLTLEFVEIHGCGSGTLHHQIYMATDESAFPGAVFRMQYCYLHDGAGGNNVKSRAQRNEIYYNWIEGASYRELELIGIDPGDNPLVTESTAREDSDVVGNVLRKTGGNPNFYVARLGGDGTGQSWGRYRFVNNTVLVADGGAPSRAVFQLFDGIESLEAHNNAIYNYNGGAAYVVSVEDGGAPANPAVVQAGTNNWIPSGSLGVPSAWEGTITGSSPGFVNLSGYDLSPTSTSPLRDAGGSAPAFGGHEMRSPLWPPAYLSPVHTVGTTAIARPSVGQIDVGAYEHGTDDGGGGGASATGAPARSGGCGAAVERGRLPCFVTVLGLLAGLAWSRGRRRRGPGRKRG